MRRLPQIRPSAGNTAATRAPLAVRVSSRYFASRMARRHRSQTNLYRLARRLSRAKLFSKRSSGGQHEYVRQLWTCDGDSDKNANRWENGQSGTGRGADRLCASIDRRPEAGAPARCAERGRMRADVRRPCVRRKDDPPGLAEALAYLRAGDTLVVWKLDRLGRSMNHLIEKVGELNARGVGFRSLT